MQQMHLPHLNTAQKNVSFKSWEQKDFMNKKLLRANFPFLCLKAQFLICLARMCIVSNHTHTPSNV